MMRVPVQTYFTLIFVVAGCSTNIEKEVDNDLVLLQEEKALEMFMNPKWQDGIRINPHFFKNGEIEAHRYGLLGGYGRLFDKFRKENFTWQQADEMISPAFDKYLTSNELGQEEKEYSITIQHITLELLWHYFTPATPSQHLGDRTVYYLNILLRHKAVDLDIMTNALLHVKDYLKKEDYAKFKNYLLSGVDNKIADVKKNWEILYSRHKQNQGRKANETDLFLTLTEEARYVKAKLEGWHTSNSHLLELPNK